MRRVEQYDALRESMVERAAIKGDIWEYERQCGERGRVEEREGVKADKRVFKAKFQDKMRQFLETKRMEESVVSEPWGAGGAKGYMSRYKEMSRQMNNGREGESEEEGRLQTRREGTAAREDSWEKGGDVRKHKPGVEKAGASKENFDEHFQSQREEKVGKFEKHEAEGGQISRFPRRKKQLNANRGHSRDVSLSSNERFRIQKMMAGKRVDLRSVSSQGQRSESPFSKKIRPIGRYRPQLGDLGREDGQKLGLKRRSRSQTPEYIRRSYHKRSVKFPGDYGGQRENLEMSRGKRESIMGQYSGTDHELRRKNRRINFQKNEIRPNPRVGNLVREYDQRERIFERSPEPENLEVHNWQDLRAARRARRSRNGGYKESSTSPNSKNVSTRKPQNRTNLYMNNYLKMARKRT